MADLSVDNRHLLALLSAAGVGALPPLVGDALRRQRELTDELRRLQQAEVQRATAAERVRIARDVHDTVGHHLSAISLQARAGELDAAGPALHTLAVIARLSDRALQDTRHILGVLHDDDGDDGLSPTPRLGDLDDLAQTAELAGVHVRLQRRGDLDDLPDSIQTCAYRIVQEALTNTAKHAAPATAELRVERHDGRVTVTIANDGALALEAPAGRGITGMRERAHAIGGTLATAPGHGGGWHVRAELPDL